MNVKLVGLRLPEPCTPVADNVADCVPALVPMFNVPVRVADAVGVNCRVTVQVAVGAKLAPQVVERNAKSVPDTEAAEGAVIVRFPIPVLLKVATAVDEALTWVLVNVGVVRVALGA